MQSTQIDAASREHMYQNSDQNIDLIFDNLDQLIDKLGEYLIDSQAMDSDWWWDRILSMVGSIASSATLGGILGMAGKIGRTGEKLLGVNRFKPKGGNFDKELESLYGQFKKSDKSIAKHTEKALKDPARYNEAYDNIKWRVTQDLTSMEEFMEKYPEEVADMLKKGYTRTDNPRIQNMNSTDTKAIFEEYVENNRDITNLNFRGGSDVENTKQLKMLMDNGITRPFERQMYNKLVNEPVLENGVWRESKYFKEHMNKYTPEIRNKLNENKRQHVDKDGNVYSYKEMRGGTMFTKQELQKIKQIEAELDNKLPGSGKYFSEALYKERDPAQFDRIVEENIAADQNLEFDGDLDKFRRNPELLPDYNKEVIASQRKTNLARNFEAKEDQALQKLLDETYASKEKGTKVIKDYFTGRSQRQALMEVNYDALLAENPVLQSIHGSTRPKQIYKTWENEGVIGDGGVIGKALKKLKYKEGELVQGQAQPKRNYKAKARRGEDIPLIDRNDVPQGYV